MRGEKRVREMCVRDQFRCETERSRVRTPRREKREYGGRKITKTYARRA